LQNKSFLHCRRILHGNDAWERLGMVGIALRKLLGKLWFWDWLKFDWRGIWIDDENKRWWGRYCWGLDELWKETSIAERLSEILATKLSAEASTVSIASIAEILEESNQNFSRTSARIFYAQAFIDCWIVSIEFLCKLSIKPINFSRKHFGRQKLKLQINFEPFHLPFSNLSRNCTWRTFDKMLKECPKQIRTYWNQVFCSLTANISI
jgi:hypothetical protein